MKELLARRVFTGVARLGETGVLALTNQARMRNEKRAAQDAGKWCMSILSSVIPKLFYKRVTEIKKKLL